MNVQNLKIFLPHPLQTLSLLQSPYYLFDYQKNMTLNTKKSAQKIHLRRSKIQKFSREEDTFPLDPYSPVDFAHDAISPSFFKQKNNVFIIKYLTQNTYKKCSKNASKKVRNSKIFLHRGHLFPKIRIPSRLCPFCNFFYSQKKHLLNDQKILFKRVLKMHLRRSKNQKFSYPAVINPIWSFYSQKNIS